MERSETINYGNRITLIGGGPQSVLSVSIRESRPFTLYCEATVQVPPAMSRASVLPQVTVNWGNGSAFSEMSVPVYGATRFPVVARSVEVFANLVDVKTGKDVIDANIRCVVSAFLSHGTEGGAARPLMQRRQGRGHEGLLAQWPTGLVLVRAHHPGLAPRFLQFFDTRELAKDGDVPAFELPLPPLPGRATEDRPQGIGFLDGVAWSVSATWGVLTRDVGADVSLDAELFA